MAILDFLVSNLGWILVSAMVAQEILLVVVIVVCMRLIRRADDQAVRLRRLEKIVLTLRSDAFEVQA